MLDGEIWKELALCPRNIYLSRGNKIGSVPIYHIYPTCEGSTKSKEVYELEIS